jgi:hypothetical protein
MISNKNQFDEAKLASLRATLGGAAATAKRRVGDLLSSAKLPGTAGTAEANELVMAHLRRMAASEGVTVKELMGKMSGNLAKQTAAKQAAEVAKVVAARKAATAAARDASRQAAVKANPMATTAAAPEAQTLLGRLGQHKKTIAAGAAGVGTAALLAKVLKSRAAARSPLSAALKKHKKPLMIGGGAFAGSAGLGALLTNS